MQYDVTTPEGQRWLDTAEAVAEVVNEYSEAHGVTAAMRDVVVVELPATRTGNGRRLDVSQFLSE